MTELHFHSLEATSQKSRGQLSFALSPSFWWAPGSPGVAGFAAASLWSLPLAAWLSSLYASGSHLFLLGEQSSWVTVHSTAVCLHLLSILVPATKPYSQSHLFRCQGFGLNPVGVAHATKQGGLEDAMLLKRVSQKRINTACIHLYDVGIQTVKITETESSVAVRA